VGGVTFDVRGELRAQWEGNRRLTLRTARAFPADRLWTFSPAAPLRTFGQLLDEISRLDLAYVRGLVEDRWAYDPQDPPPASDAEGAIRLLEQSTAYVAAGWDRISEETLLAKRHDPFFFGDDHRPLDWLVYCIENEIHHRGQGYVYLRELGVEPPHFYER
jgi:uncharacterized damage-inducible protein DinB